MDDLIYDRTLSDVETALRTPNSSEFLKGAYNYTDLNRVEGWCEYIQELLRSYGFNQELETKTDWNVTDFPSQAQIDRIRNNIDTLKNFCYAISTETIEYNNTLDYEQANILEKILFDINQYIEEILVTLTPSPQMGFLLVRRKYIHLKVEEE